MAYLKDFDLSILNRFTQYIASLRYKRRFREFGKRSTVYSPLYVKHPQNISIGEDVEIRFQCGLYARVNGNSKGIAIGNKCRIKEFSILDSYGGFIQVGEQVLIGQSTTIHGHGGVTIGDYTLMGQHVRIYSNTHIYKELPRSIQEQGEEFLNTTIGENVWIGSDCTILGGVTIGDNCVIGAGSVVDKDIPPCSLAVGVPAKVTKTIC